MPEDKTNDLDAEAQAASQKPVPTVTEDDLKKSLAALEEKVPPKEDPPLKTVVETEALAKAGEVLDAEASEELKKALEVSEVLSEFVGLMGIHVDTSLEAMAKSLQASADRDLAVVRVLEGMQKSIDAISSQVAKYGEQPAAPAGAATAEVKDGEVLHKSETPDAVDPAKAKAITQTGLELLTKSASEAGNEAAQNEFLNAAVKFETTGTISDEHLAKANNAYKRSLDVAA